MRFPPLAGSATCRTEVYRGQAKQIAERDVKTAAELPLFYTPHYTRDKR
jgi:hypothetical protein